MLLSPAPAAGVGRALRPLLLVGGYGRAGSVAVGQVVERLPRVARRVKAYPAHQHVGPDIMHLELEQVISPDFPLELTGFFPGKHLIHFLVLKMKDSWDFVLD